MDGETDGQMDSHLDGVDKSQEAQAAEVDVQGVAERPDQVVPGRLAAVPHVDDGGAAGLARGLAAGEGGAV